MHFRSYLAASAAGLALTSMAVIEAQAQETTSAMRGVVTDESGAAIAGATIAVTDTRTGAMRTLTSDASGGFSLQNMNVGGPYRVEVTAQDHQTTQVDDVFLNLGDTAMLNLALPAAAAGADRVIVTGSRVVAQTAIGPSATFSLETLQNSPAINRDLKDIIRMDPRIYLDESFQDAIQCAGGHPRFNSLTVDGIGLNDAFGLNGNGYPTERMPFPYDAISQVSVELAPFDVQYGGFTACNINAVTKSGGNALHGSLFFDYTDSGLRGDSIEGEDIFVPEFDEKRYGGTISGPIWGDRLFFFAAYEKFEGQNLFFRGPEGSGAANEIVGFTQAEYDQIRSISQNVYGYDPGETPVSAPAEDEKLLIRLDANISNRHRATFTYNYNTALNLTESDDGNNEFEYFNHFYNRGAELNAYAGQFFSDWTDNFSTELRAAYNDVDFTQASVNGTDVGEIQITDSGNTIYLGADDSRHSNDLDYTTLNLKAAANYEFRNHTLTAGAEMLTYDIFNLFVQHTEGEYRFNSIADFAAGNAARVYYGNAGGTNDPTDAAAEFKYDITTLYLQDEMIWGDFVVTAGLRYEWYSNDDVPNANPGFLARNGFSNTENLDGKSQLLPRLGFEWAATDRLSVHGGVGLYSGGNPNVWVANSYQNDGTTTVQLEYRPTNAPATRIGNLFTEPFVEDEGGSGRPLWGVPARMYDAVASGTADTSVNAIDPDYNIPTELKVALGAVYDFDLGRFGEDYRLLADVLYSAAQEGSKIVDAALEQVGTAPDGRPIYRRIDRSDPDCAAGPAAPACASRGFNNDLILTNSDGGEQLVLSAAVTKAYDFGLDWSLAYAFVKSEDVSPMTSSVAFSNWTSIATSDINNPEKTTSNYEIPHRFTGRISYEHNFLDDLATRVTLFGQMYQGRSYSYTFADTSTDMFGDGQDYVHLLYVPLQNDPNVTYAPGFDLAAFDAFIASNGLERGAIAERNGQDSSWTNKFDLRFEQEFPGFMDGHNSAGFITIENVGNLIDDDWGVVHQAPFPQRTGVVDATIDPATGNYVYREFFDRHGESRDGITSFWTIRAGVRYEF